MDEELPYLVASLIEHFHLTPTQVGKLTRRQIHELYLWPRDEHGGLQPPLTAPKPPPVVPKKVDVLRTLAAHFKAMGKPIKGIEERIKEVEKTN